MKIPRPLAHQRISLIRTSVAILVAIGLAAGLTTGWAAGALAADSTSFPPVAFPRVPMPIDEVVEIGELRNRLVLDSVVESDLHFDEERLVVRARLTEPNLYSKLETALRSTAKDGCSSVQPTGSSGSFEFELCHIARPSIRFDRSSRSARVRASAKVRTGISGMSRETSSHDVVAEYRTEIRGAEIVLSPRSIHIEGVPAGLDPVLLASMDVIRIPLDACLKAADLRIDDIHLEPGANEVVAIVSTPTLEALGVVQCVALRHS